MPWSAMRARDEHDVAGPHELGTERPSRGDDTDAGGGDVAAVGGTAADHLGVAGDDGDAGGRCRFGHVGDDGRAARRPGTPPRSRRPPTATAGARPVTARSLTVPCTARCPIEPPGKRSGCTTNESVVKPRRSPSGRWRVAASASGLEAAPSRSPCGANASRNTASTSAADALPPAPWASVTTSSVSRGPAPAERLDAVEDPGFAIARRQPSSVARSLLHRGPQARSRARPASPGCGARCRSGRRGSAATSGDVAISPPS